MKSRSCVRLRALPLVMAMSLAMVLTVFVTGCSSSSSSSKSTSKKASEKIELVHKGKLTVASDLANPPFDYMEGTTKKGFEVELMDALAKKLGLTVNYLNPMKFDSIIPTVKQGGKADVGASNFTITADRKKEIDFTDAYIDSNQGIVTSKATASSVGSDVNVLNKSGVTVAVQSGTTGESWVEENLPNAKVVALDDPISALSGVSTGLYNAAVADLPVMQYEVKNSYTSLSVAKEIATGEQYGIVVSKDNPALTKALNKALKQLRKDGTLSTLEKKWFGVDYEAQSASAAATSTTTNGDAGSVVVSKATARPNEDGGDRVIGGINTRLTWEATTKVEDGVSSVTLKLPSDASFEGSTTKVTVLKGLTRVNIDGKATAKGNTVTIKFASPIPNGSLLRLEITDMKFPNQGGKYQVTGSYTTAAGVKGTLPASAKIKTISNTPVQQIVMWLDGQPWVTAWNSVPFLNMFFKPQLLVTSFVSLFGGWVLCLLIVVISYPFAIALGLLFAMMKISRFKVLRGLASIYINLLRGTPLFLQIYIMFFGLPMIGINIDNNVLGVIVMAINSSAYQAEIYRAGILSIPNGQYEAAASLGMNRAQTMFTVILPQMVRRVIPTVTSDFITSYKDTSLLSSVGVMELMMFSKNLTTTTGNITPYMAAAIYYLIVTLPLIKVVSIVEKHLADAENGVGPRPRGRAAKRVEAAEGEKGESAEQDAEPKDTSAFEALAAPFRSHASQEA
jgi:His/Glu/Gln/Arg/opine family amino acid ABC transporter permease subunit